MLTKKQAKKTATKKIVHPQKTNKINRLKTWLFDKPIVFAVLTFLINLAVGITYAIIANVFAIQAMWPMKVLFFASFCCTTYYLIKKLPHGNMYRDDFVAITNGCWLVGGLLSIFIPLIMISIFGRDVNNMYYALMVMYVTHPVMLWVLGILFALFFFYLLGVMISGVYAKYKRAVEIGISKGKVILSMPFGFLLMWMPGYLLPSQKQESNLEIKSKWFAKFNEWVVSNKTNTLFTFLMLLLLRNTFSNSTTLLLILFLLVIYTLWIAKYKKSFTKNINHGYAWTAVAINIALVIFTLFVFITAGTNNSEIEITTRDFNNPTTEIIQNKPNM